MEELTVSVKSLPAQIDEYINGWCVLNGFRKATLYTKTTLFKRLLHFLNGRDLTLATANEFILLHTQHGNSLNTVATETRNLRAFNHWQVKTGYAALWADKMVQPKQMPTEMEILPEAILAEIIDAGTEPKKFRPGKSGDHTLHRRQKLVARRALHFMRLHGTRIGETLNIRGKDLKLNDDPPTAWINRKGGKRVLLPLHLDFIDDLRGYADPDKVFPVSRELLNLAIQRGAAAMGYGEKLVTHSLRHSFATNKIREGNNLPQVSRILGHSSILITDKMYTHLNVTDIAKVLNSNAVYGIPISEKLEDIQRYIKDKTKKDPRFTVTDNDVSEDEKEIVLTLRIVATKPLPV